MWGGNKSASSCWWSTNNGVNQLVQINLRDGNKYLLEQIFQLRIGIIAWSCTLSETGLQEYILFPYIEGAATS